MNESEMTSELLRGFQEDSIVHDTELEKHYNYYGDRGIVDIVDVRRYDSCKPKLDIYELKSEAAIEDATGANEIIRQFNRHQEYFFDGQDEYQPYNTYREITFLLTFYACEKTIDHIDENIELYHNAADAEHGTSEIAVFHEEYGRVNILEGSESVRSSSPVCGLICDEVMG